MQEAILRQAKLIGTQLLKANLLGADLCEANLSEANLIEATLRDAKLNEANLQNAKLSEANLRETSLIGANLREADLSKAKLVKAQLVGANLRGTILVESDLRDAKLIGANLHGADLRGADLRRANLFGANLIGANLEGARLEGANLREVYVSEHEREYLHDKGIIGLYGVVDESSSTKHLVLSKDEPLIVTTQVPQATLSLFAIAIIALEKGDRALVEKPYSLLAGISQLKPEDFAAERFSLSLDGPIEPIWFDILLHASDNIKVIEDWQQRLHYSPRNSDLQLVSFTFRSLAPGKSYLVINFYRERRWLKTIRLEFTTD